MENLDKWFYILVECNGHEEETILRKNIELKTLFKIENVYVSEYENNYLFISNNLDNLNKLKTSDYIDMDFFISENEMFLDEEMKYYKENNENNDLDEEIMETIL